MSCHIATCTFDAHFDAGEAVDVTRSDCYGGCSVLFVCFDEVSGDQTDCQLEKVLGNGKCDQEYSIQECAWDMGDCGYCAQNCTV